MPKIPPQWTPADGPPPLICHRVGDDWMTRSDDRGDALLFVAAMFLGGDLAISTIHDERFGYV